MTKKQFKEALLRGQGRCIQATQTQPDKYFDIVLWACSHEIAFDAQCEGTRSWFVYQLIDCYEDKAPFLKRAIEGLENTKLGSGWKMLYLAELLSFFAEDGASDAKRALWHKYEMLYKGLMARKRPPRGTFCERDDFAMLCQVLGEDKTSFLKIAGDIGRLFQEKAFLDGFDFDWLYESKGRRYLSALTKAAKKSEDIRKYLSVMDAYEKACEERGRSRNQNTTRKGVALSVWLKRRADKETIFKYVQTYLEQCNPEDRADALIAFSRCPYPENPLPIIEDASSNCEALSKAAWLVLGNIRHPMVRKFVLENLQNHREEALPVFITNYQDEDAKKLVEYIKAIPVDYGDSTGWHGIHLDVLEMVDNGQKAPAELLRYIYETNYCSCCREYTLKQMGKRRMLTDDILQECLLDCNSEIRVYAKSFLRRKKN